MRLLLVVIFVMILGTSLGIAHTWSEFSGIEEQMVLSSSVKINDSDATVAEAATTNQRPARSTGTPRAIVVGETRNDFGVMTRYASSSHTFVVRNDGDADLLVEKQTVSCSLCVITTFDRATVKPGEEVSIPVTLSTKKPGPALNETLEVRTSDPDHEVIRFDLIAYIADAAGASVSELALGTISTDEGGAASFHVYGFVDEPVEIVECKMFERENQKYFAWQVGDLTEEAVKAGQPHAKSGKEIKVTIEPGLPVGPLEQNFTIVARAGEEVTISLPVSGRVTGDLSLIGGSTFTADKSLLSLGRILVGEGASAKLHMMVKGNHRADVRLTVGECDPVGYLSATVGEPKAIQDGKAYLHPVTVELDKSAPTMNRLGGVGASVGKIIIHTTHPTAKEVTLYVRFAVE
ncbi:MAG: DUF1573 domain-containing protein [Planctomycetota bacterium]